MGPRAIAAGPWPVAIVDLVHSGGTIRDFVDLLLRWADDLRLDRAAVRRRLRIVGVTYRTKSSPNTRRWQQAASAAWLDEYPRIAAKNVSIPGRLWAYLGNDQPKVTPSHPPWRWADPTAAEPDRHPWHLLALRHAVRVFDRGTQPAERERFAGAVAKAQRLSVGKPVPAPGTMASSVPTKGDDGAYIAYDQGQYLTALRLAQAAAATGDPQAHTLIGRINAEGFGIPRDLAAAAAWYAKAAELGDTEAMFAIALLHAEGRGVAKDRLAAAQWFERAAARGHPAANYNLGLLFLRGDGKPENPIRASQHLRYAAEKGITAAQYDLGGLYQKGVGVEADALQAAHWIGLAARAGMPEAQFEYAVMLLRGRRRAPRRNACRDSHPPWSLSLPHSRLMRRRLRWC